MSAEPSAESDAPAAVLTPSEKADLFSAACRAHRGPATFICRPCADAQDAVIERVISARLACAEAALAAASLLADEWEANYEKWANVGPDAPKVAILRVHANRLRAALRTSVTSPGVTQP